MRLRRVSLALGGLALAALAGLSIATLTARLAAPCELLSNLRWPLGAVGVPALILLGVARRPWLAALALLLTAWHVGPELTLGLGGRPAAPRAGVRLEVASVNLLFGRVEPDRLEDWFTREGIDVLGLLEVQTPNEAGHDWPARFEAWRQRFPHQVVHLEGDSFGMALLSRFPLEDVARANPPGTLDPYAGRPVLIEVTGLVGDHPVRIALTHPQRPGAAWRVEAREACFDHLEAPRGARTVVFGDLNCTGTSPAFRDLLRAGYRDSRRGFGLCASWEHGRFPGRWIALDHLLTRGDVSVVARSAGPDLGSDHLPLRATLVVVPD